MGGTRRTLTVLATLALLAPTLPSVATELAAGTHGSPGQDTGPWPTPGDDQDPYAYEEYLSIDREADAGSPNDFVGGEVWKFSSEQSGNPEVDNDPTELNGVTGMSIDEAWTTSTGRPDVVIAVIDSGIRWSQPDLVKQTYINTGELPLPEDASGQTANAYDRNADGMVNVADYAQDPRVADQNGNGLTDAQDLIVAFSDGEDDDANGYADDVSGWNFLDDTNDPFDEVDYSHGTGNSQNSLAQANNSHGLPGSCPNCMLMPMRGGQSFIVHGIDYARAVIYAVDNGASVVQTASGAVDHTDVGKRANEYALEHGVPVVASAADEAAQHHNWPAAHEHAIVANSVRDAGGFTQAPRSYLFVNGCTNYGSYITVAVTSTRCSSEATGRLAGIVALLESHARNEVARGDLEPHPEADRWPSGNVLSAPEVRSMVESSADDIDIGPRPVVSPVPTTRYATTDGWDPYTGAGRANAAQLLEQASAGQIPPDATLTEPRRWAPLATGHPIEVAFEASAHRAAPGSYALQLGCTNDPQIWHTIDEGSVPADGIEVSRTLTLGAALEVCPVGVGANEPTAHHVTGPDENRHTVMVRLVVIDAEGTTGVDRRAVITHADKTLADGWPVHAEGGVESTPELVDLDGDGTEEILVSTASGQVRAYEPDGTELPGWPVATDDHPAAVRHGLVGGASNETAELADSPHTPPFARLPGGAGPGDIPVRFSGSHGGIGAADLDGDASPEVVQTTLQGDVYAWNADGTRLTGFPVHIDPAFSEPSIRDPDNTIQEGVQAAPVLVDLDGDGDREIVAAALDRHVYAWHHTGEPVDGFPALLADRDVVDVDPIDHTVTPKEGVEPFRGSKILSTPAACDIDGDGTRELVLGTNAHYAETPRMSASVAGLAAETLLGGSNGRLFALEPDGTYVDGWPIQVPDIAPGLLPYVGQGIVASPACGDTDGDGRDEVAIQATAGPVMLYNGTGGSALGSGPEGQPRGFPMDVAGPASAARDLPYLPALGSPMLGELTPDQVGVFAPAAGVGRLLDIGLPGKQMNAQDYLAGWDARTGAPLPAFPQPIEDVQFVTTQALLDLDGDGESEVAAVSAGGSVHAWEPTTGTELPGFPKVTGHWMIGTPAASDVDGDEDLELVVTSREGWVWTWDLPTPASGGHEWPSDHYDAANTGRWSPAPGLVG